MGSTRLPGKVLKEINGLPIIVHIYRRLLACRELDGVAVSWGGSSQQLQPTANRYKLRYWCADEIDLIDRHLWAGNGMQADAILRVRADCLFLDPKLMDDLVRAYRNDYPRSRAISNWPRRTYTEGMDAEVWSMELLGELDQTLECPREDFTTWAMAQDKYHITVGMQNPINEGLPHLSIDTQDDFDRAEKILKYLGSNDIWSYDKTLEAYHATDNKGLQEMPKT